MIVLGPEEIEKPITRKRLIREARYVDEPTGRMQKIQIREIDGSITEEERPITDRVFYEPVYANDPATVNVWIVDTEKNGMTERHEFSSFDAAQKFVEGYS